MLKQKIDLSHMLSKSERKELESLQDYRKCWICKEMKYIPFPGEYPFKRSQKGKIRWYCGWACFRVEDKRKR